MASRACARSRSWSPSLRSARSPSWQPPPLTSIRCRSALGRSKTSPPRRGLIPGITHWAYATACRTAPAGPRRRQLQPPRMTAARPGTPAIGLDRQARSRGNPPAGDAGEPHDADARTIPRPPPAYRGAGAMQGAWSAAPARCRCGVIVADVIARAGRAAPARRPPRARGDLGGESRHAFARTPGLEPADDAPSPEVSVGLPGSPGLMMRKHSRRTDRGRRARRMLRGAPSAGRVPCRRAPTRSSSRHLLASACAKNAFLDHDQAVDLAPQNAGATEQHPPTRWNTPGPFANQPATSNEGRHRHRAGKIDASVRWPDAVEPAERGRHAHSIRRCRCPMRSRRRWRAVAEADPLDEPPGSRPGRAD